LQAPRAVTTACMVRATAGGGKCERTGERRILRSEISADAVIGPDASAEEMMSRKGWRNVRGSAVSSAGKVCVRWTW
jgi:hypothetical protein